MGAKPYRLARVTGVPENTIRRVFSEPDKVHKLKLESAEKLAAYYDSQILSLIQAITALDELLYLLEPNRQRLSGNPNLMQRLQRTPFAVCTKLHQMAFEPTYISKHNLYKQHLEIIESSMSNIEFDFADNIKLPDDYLFLMSLQRNSLAKLKY